MFSYSVWRREMEVKCHSDSIPLSRVNVWIFIHLNIYNQSYIFLLHIMLIKGLVVSHLTFYSYLISFTLYKIVSLFISEVHLKFNWCFNAKCQKMYFMRKNHEKETEGSIITCNLSWVFGRRWKVWLEGHARHFVLPKKQNPL